MMAIRSGICAMTELKLVLFDLDGTLADSHAFLTRVVGEAFAHVGASLPDAERMREFYSLTYYDFFKRCGDLLSPDQIVAASDYMHHTLLRERSTGALIEPFYPGIKAALDELLQAGYLLGIVTNKPGHGLNSVLATNEAAHYFVTLNNPDNAATKPAPDMVLNGLRATGAEPANCVVVGDSLVDMLTARNAGVRAIGVTWAGRDAGPLADAGAIAVLDRVEQLVPAIMAAL